MFRNKTGTLVNNDNSIVNYINNNPQIHGM